MSFWKKLFGGGAGEAAGPGGAKAVKTIEHKGFLIQATPYKENGQFQTCGIVSKEVDGALKEHRFVRADRFPSLDEAVEVSLAKGRQIIEEQGEQVFR